jgi:hypothetical protein
VRLDPARGRDGRPFDQDQVDAIDRVAEELRLERLVGRVVLGEHQQARGVAVESVDQADLRPRLPRGHVLAHHGQQRRSPLPRHRAGQQPGGLVHDQDVVVLIDNRRRGERVWGTRTSAHRFGWTDVARLTFLDDVARAQRVLEV